MTTQVIFRIDKKLKDAAQKTARAQGISLSDFYKSATRDFVAGKMRFGLEYPTIKPNAKTARIIRQAMKDIKEGKNLSPVFKTGEEMDRYLDSL